MRKLILCRHWKNTESKRRWAYILEGGISPLQTCLSVGFLAGEWCQDNDELDSSWFWRKVVSKFEEFFYLEKWYVRKMLWISKKSACARTKFKSSLLEHAFFILFSDVSADVNAWVELICGRSFTLLVTNSAAEQWINSPLVFAFFSSRKSSLGTSFGYTSRK